MRMLWLVAVMMGVFLGSLSSIAEAGPRYGTVIDLQPIENRGDDESDQTKKNRKLGSRLGGFLGSFAGVGIIGASDSTAGTVAGRAVADNGDKIGGELAAKAGGAGPTTRYMIKVKLESGKTLVVTQPRQQIEGVEIGTRVRVEGKGDEAVVHAEQLKAM